MDTSDFETRLTKDDLALIEEVYKATERRAEDGTLIAPGIICFRGPETGKLFPRDGKPAYQTVPPLGRVVDRGATGTGQIDSKVQRFVERMCRGSKRWPMGVPVGIQIRHTKVDMETQEFKPTTGTSDIGYEERQRLEAVSNFRTFMTPAERALDERKKEEQRRLRESPDQNAAMDLFAKMLASATMEETRRQFDAEVAAAGKK